MEASSGQHEFRTVKVRFPRRYPTFCLFLLMRGASLTHGFSTVSFPPSPLPFAPSLPLIPSPDGFSYRFCTGASAIPGSDLQPHLSRCLLDTSPGCGNRCLQLSNQSEAPYIPLCDALGLQMLWCMSCRAYVIGPGPRESGFKPSTKLSPLRRPSPLGQVLCRGGAGRCEGRLGLCSPRHNVC